MSQSEFMFNSNLEFGNWRNSVIKGAILNVPNCLGNHGPPGQVVQISIKLIGQSYYIVCAATTAPYYVHI